jgi:hypothetical protein
MKKITLATCITLAATAFASGGASALECGGIYVPDALALAIVNEGAAGYRYEISNLKTLVINRVESISGSQCHLNARANVTLKRKIRRDASGTVSMKGDLYVNAGKICIANPTVTDVSLSHTLEIGESVYQWVANKSLPTNLCL